MGVARNGRNDYLVFLLAFAKLGYRASAAGVPTAVFCACVASAIAQTPSLRLEYIDGDRVTPMVGQQPLRVPSTKRIRLTVALEPVPPRAGEPGGERLEVQAENYAPGYFANRPPANVDFLVRRIDGTTSTDVPYKIYSSGWGSDL